MKVEEKEVENFVEPKKKKCKYIKKEPTPPPKLVADKKAAAKIKKESKSKEVQDFEVPKDGKGSDIKPELSHHKQG